MKLYRDYKEEQALRKQEQEDRENLGIPAEVVVIYEAPKIKGIIRKMGSALLLMVLLVAIGAVFVLCAGMLTYAGVR